MTFNAQALLDDLKAKALPILEKDAVMVIDTLLASIEAQAIAQPGDLVASIVTVAIGALKPVIDAELAKLLPVATT